MTDPQVTAATPPPNIGDKASSLTIPAANLVRVLHDALPFAGTDTDLPQISAVYIEAAGGVFTVTATNRYVLGHARTTCDGGLPAPLLISADDARLIAQLFRPNRRSVTGPTVTIITDEHVARFAYADSDSLGLLPELGVAVRLRHIAFPKYQHLLTRRSKADWDGSTAIGFNPRLLNLFGKVTDANQHHLRMFLNGPTRATVVEIGEDFIGIVMPVKIAHDGQEAKTPTVPIGPAAKKARRSKGAAA